jgi:formate dehydrogenase major subunit
MELGTKNDRLVSSRPVLDAPVSKGHLCVKGRYALDFVYANDRVTEPMIREDGNWRRVSWDEAITFTANGLQQIKNESGPDRIALLGSARGTNEENYLAQKFARLVVGTNNVDCCARVCHTPTAAAMKMMLGTGAATNSYDDIESARTILVCGANPTENHPIIGARIKQAALQGVNLIVIDPRKIELATYATIYLQPLPGTNIPLLNSIAHTILEEQLLDRNFLGDRVGEFDEFAAFIEQFAPEKVAELCGLNARLIREAARLYATAKPSICFHGLGVTEHTQGTEGVMCLVNLALLTGNIGRRGTGINPLRGQNNVQGAAHMGCDPGILTGSVSVIEARGLFEHAWGAPLPKTRGLNMIEMMDHAAAGNLRALWAIGYDVALTNADANATAQALSSLDLVIVQDLFLNETARAYGSVFLPAASSFERDGTFMNAERRIQRIRKAIEPVGNAKPDWEIICAIAKALNHGDSFTYGSAEDIWNEIRTVWPAANGVAYSRLDHQGLQWPCPSDDHPGTEMLHSESFALGKTASLRCVAYVPTIEHVDQEFPFLLVTGRTLYQFNAGTMTMRTANSELRPEDVLDIGPEDAARLNLRDGDLAQVRSRYGETVLPVRVTSTVMPGQVFATFHTTRAYLNRVTSSHRDRYVKSPEYKVTAVHLAKKTTQ